MGVEPSPSCIWDGLVPKEGRDEHPPKVSKAMGTISNGKYAAVHGTGVPVTNMAANRSVALTSTGTMALTSATMGSISTGNTIRFTRCGASAIM